MSVFYRNIAESERERQEAWKRRVRDAVADLKRGVDPKEIAREHGGAVVAAAEAEFRGQAKPVEVDSLRRKV